MTDRAVQIRGAADEFEAAVIAVVLDHVEAEERAVSGRLADKSRRLPAWVRALGPHQQGQPRLRIIAPD